MIVVSVLLILVAVTLLVVGLAGGSSTLLISSIVASLLAAVALVIGARQAAAMRRAVVDPATPGVPPIDLEAGAPVAEPVGARSGGTGFAAATTASAMAAASGRGTGRRGPQPPEPSFADGPSAPDEGLHSPPETHPRVANRDDAESALAADAAYRESDPSYGTGEPVYGSAPGAEPVYDDAAAFDDFRATHGEAVPGPHADRDGARPTAAAQPGADDDPDYDRASTFIGGARSENPGANSWRRAHAHDRLDPDAGPQDRDDLDDPLRPDGPQRATGPRLVGADPPPPGTSPYIGGDDLADPPGHPGGSGFVSGSGSGAGSGFVSGSGFAGGPGPAEEFAEPDADDPDDEPLPQAVRPADAVQVARMNDEVMVVDGRPRYHIADCPHLAGRQTEPLPVSEAVELGFSPCGQCRPVDRLVARATRR
jgi:hypothetical protein